MYWIQVNRNSIDTRTQTFTSIDDFINNSIATASVGKGDPGHGTRATQVGVYIQDTFQVRPGLTLDYGLRYDYATPPHDAFDNTQTFDTRTLTLAAPGTPYFQANKKNFGPRFAFAWSATVLASSASMFCRSSSAGASACSSSPIPPASGLTVFR